MFLGSRIQRKFKTTHYIIVRRLDMPLCTGGVEATVDGVPGRLFSTVLAICTSQSPSATIIFGTNVSLVVSSIPLHYRKLDATTPLVRADFREDRAGQRGDIEQLMEGGSTDNLPNSRTWDMGHET